MVYRLTLFIKKKKKEENKMGLRFFFFFFSSCCIAPFLNSYRIVIEWFDLRFYDLGWAFNLFLISNRNPNLMNLIG